MTTEQLNTRSGFTLIELMVVISIIALLSSVILASLRPATADARDASRLEETHSIGNALELYYLANGHYPIHTTSQNISIQNMVTGDLTPYMPPLPSTYSVPNETDYYVSDSAGSGYELLVARETSTSGSSGGSGTSAPNLGCNTSDYGNYLGIVNTGVICRGVNVTASLWTPPVNPNTPTVTISSSPLGTLNQGQPVSLTWSSTNAASCQITGDTTGIFGGYEGGAMPTSDILNQTVYTIQNGGDAQTGTVTVTCYSGNLTGLSNSANVTITVSTQVESGMSVNAYMSPSADMNPGDPGTFYWYSTGAYDCGITGDTTGLFQGYVGGSIGGPADPEPSGSLNVGSDGETGTVTITCYSGHFVNNVGTGSSVSANVNITINGTTPGQH